MSRGDVMEPPTGLFKRLNVDGATRNSTPDDAVRPSMTDDERGDLEISTWQACKEGRYADAKSNLAKLEPQHVSHFVNYRDKDDNTALIVASAAAHKDVACATIIPLLLEGGADINAKNKKGRTAMMEAALWGGFAAVKALLNWKRGSLADANLKDKSGFKAVDLAKTNKKLAIERRGRCADGEHVQKHFDEKLRISIVKLLKHVGNSESVLQSTQHVGMPKPVEGGKEEINAKMLKKTQAKLKVMERLAGSRLNELEWMKRELKKKEELLAEEHSKFMKAQADMNDVYAKFGSLNRSNADTTDQNPQFRETRMLFGPSWIKFDFMMTFDVTPKHADATMAYMKINERHFFAKNGKAHDTQDGYISGREYSEEAFQLLELLGSRRDSTYFQHVEPQLMALYVEDFRNGEGFTLVQFIEHQPTESLYGHGNPLVVEIFVSARPCPTCVEHKDMINEAARRHNFEFVLTYATC